MMIVSWLIDYLFGPLCNKILKIPKRVTVPLSRSFICPPNSLKLKHDQQKDKQKILKVEKLRQIHVWHFY